MKRFLLAIALALSGCAEHQATPTAPLELRALLESPAARTASPQDLVALVYAHPREVEQLYKSIGPDQFAAAVRSVPAEAWAAQPAAYATFAKKAPNAARVIADYVTGSVQPPAPPPPPAPPMPPGSAAWQEVLQRQMFFMAAPNYFFDDVPDAHIRPWLTAIRDAGLTGPSIELNGEFPVHEYNGSRIKNLDVAAVYAGQFAAWRKWMPIIRELGLVAHVSFLNSNQSDANRMLDSWWYETARSFAIEFGSENMIVLGLNETDPRTRSSIGQAIYAGLEAGGFPRSQLIGYSNKGPYGFVETHPKDNASIRKGDHTVLNIPDHGKAIQTMPRQLYGDDWKNGGNPQLENIRKYTRAVKQAGTSGAIYSFGRVPDLAGMHAAADAWRN